MAKVVKKLNMREEKRRRLQSQFDSYMACTDCMLCENRRVRVQGDGDTNAEVMIVGEGPGQTEDMYGYPFIGDAGQLLRKALTNLGIETLSIKKSGIDKSIDCSTFKGVYITNIVKCRPPDNRAPTDSEIRTCIKNLKAEIEIIKPKIIIALGNTASKVLVPNSDDSYRITRDRGKLVFNEELNCLVITDVHPSYILRQSDAKIQAKVKWDFWHTLRYAFHEAGLRHDVEFIEPDMEPITDI